jgi:hypothetical protein
MVEEDEETCRRGSDTGSPFNSLSVSPDRGAQPTFPDPIAIRYIQSFEFLSIKVFTCLSSKC